MPDIGNEDSGADAHDAEHEVTEHGTAIDADVHGAADHRDADGKINSGQCLVYLLRYPHGLVALIVRERAQ